VGAVRSSLNFPKQIDFRRRRRTEQLKSGHPAPWPYEPVLPVIEATPKIAANYVAFLDKSIQYLIDTKELFLEDNDLYKLHLKFSDLV